MITIDSLKNCQQDRPAAGAHGQLDPDLPRPLLDDDPHDRGDADAADEEGERADDPQEDGEGQEKGRELLLEIERVPDGDGVRVGRIEADQLGKMGLDVPVTALFRPRSRGRKMKLETYLSP